MKKSCCIEKGFAKTASFANWIFVKKVSGTPDAQGIKAALQQASDYADEAGMKNNSIVKCDITLPSEALIDEVVSAYKEVISDQLPAFRFQFISTAPFCVELTGVLTSSGITVERFGADEKTGIPAAVRAGDFIYTSAMLPDTLGSLEEQAVSAISKAVEAVKLAGGETNDVIKNFVELDDCANFDAFNIPYAKCYGVFAEPAARSLIGVSGIFGYKVSVDSIAYLGTDKKCVAIGALAGKMPFCSAYVAAGLIFGSGQIGIIGADGQYILDCDGQCTRLMEVIRGVIEASGGSESEMLKTVSYALTEEYQVPLVEANVALRGESCAYADQLVPGLANPFILVEMEFVAAL